MEKEVKQISLKERYKLKSRDMEEFIEDAYFIEGEDYLHFLTEHGYNVAGYCTSRKRDENNNMVFSPMDSHTPWLDDALILIGDDNEREGYSDGLNCQYVENNPFVKIISMSLTEFEIRLVSKYYRWEKIEEHNVYAYVIKGDLEKDLSMEWIKFLADRYLEYEQYMIKRYVCVRRNAIDQKEDVDRLVAEGHYGYNNRLLGDQIKLQKIIEKSNKILTMLSGKNFIDNYSKDCWEEDFGI